MPVYCSNFYGFIQCRGFAPRFGERCTYCTINGRGRPLQPGRLPADEPDWTPSHTPSDEDNDDEFDHVVDHALKQALCQRRGAGTRVRQQLQALLDDRRLS